MILWILFNTFLIRCIVYNLIELFWYSYLFNIKINIFMSYYLKYKSKNGFDSIIKIINMYQWRDFLYCSVLYCWNHHLWNNYFSWILIAIFCLLLLKYFVKLHGIIKKLPELFCDYHPSETFCQFEIFIILKSKF